MAALDSEADVLLLGGAAGSLKSSTMLVDLIRERELPRMRSYFFRRTYSELEGGDSAIDQAHQLFPQTGAVYNAGKHTWTWPSGAEFFFKHCQHEKDVYQYQGHAISAGAIDESTHWPEKLVRYLLTRNRSTDPDMFTRWRLGTNPGNIGNDWHMRLFFPDVRAWPHKMLGVCPHCTPQHAPPQGALRFDARWPSDGKPLSDDSVKISVSYILSSIRDHSLYADKYIALLKNQTESTAKALLEGCWKQFEGQFFDIWDYERMTIDPKELNEQWWHPSWVGTDYGFSISVPAAVKCVHTPGSVNFPMGRVIVVDETDFEEIRDKSSKPFAEVLQKRWVTYKSSHGDEVAHERRWMPWYLGPDSFENRGGQFTIAGQMNEVLEKWGVQFTKARNDRQGGWMKMYNMLRDGELLISRKCQHTINALESRIKDPERENDVLKIPGDPLDDYADCSRYAIYSWATASEVGKPATVRAEEALSKFDSTLRAVHEPRWREEIAKEGAGTTYSQTGRALIQSKLRRY